MFRGARGQLPPPVEDIEAYWSPDEKARVSHMLARSYVGSADTVREGLEVVVGETRADELIVASAIHDHAARVHSYEILWASGEHSGFPFPPEKSRTGLRARRGGIDSAGRAHPRRSDGLVPTGGSADIRRAPRTASSTPTGAQLRACLAGAGRASTVGAPVRGVLTAVAIGVAVPALALVGWAATRDDDGQELGALLDRVVDAGAPGALIVVKDGSTVRVAARGFADRDAARPMRPDDRFRIGSVTKTFVAALVLQLVEEGRLRLDDPIERWLPGLVPGGRSITVRHLLSHTAGLPDYVEDPASAGSRNGGGRRRSSSRSRSRAPGSESLPVARSPTRAPTTSSWA